MITSSHFITDSKPPRLEHHRLEGHLLRVWGERDVLEISAPIEGVLRVRHAPEARAQGSYPVLREKQSVAVLENLEPLPLQVRPQGGGLLISAEGVRLWLELSSGRWSFMEGQAELVEFRADAIHNLATRPQQKRDAEQGNANAAAQNGVKRSTLVLNAPKGEGYLGFGEKVGGLNKRGMKLVFWNTSPVHFDTDTDPLYVSIPFFMGLHKGRAWGAFLDETWRSEVDIAATHSEQLSWSSAGTELDLYLIAGHQPTEVLRRYTALTGRAPLPPLWSLGMQQSRWGYTSDTEVLEAIQGYRQHSLPLDVIYLDIDYMDAYKVFSWHPTLFPDPAALIEQAKALGVKIVTIIDPGIKQEAGYTVYEQASSSNALLRTSRGDLLVGEVWPRPAVFPDFSQGRVREWWAGLTAQWSRSGIAGIWNDMNEPCVFSFQNEASPVEGKKNLPYGVRHARGTHLELHNVYGFQMTQATWQGLKSAAPDKRPFILNRAGYAGIQRYAVTWTGDNIASWEHLALSVPLLLGMGASGLPFVGGEIGGFREHPSGELLTRWMQWGAFSPQMRNHTALGTPLQESWRYGPEYLEAMRTAIEMRYRLLPTLYTLMYEASRNGLPPLRPLFLHHPTDPHTPYEDTQALFGAGLLIAPVLRSGVVQRPVYLPEGEWLEWFSLGQTGGTHLGQQYVSAKPALEQIPLYLHAGHAIALTPPAQHTTSANWGILEWHIHVGRTVQAELYEDQGEGYGAYRHTTLEGQLEPNRFHLTRRVQGQLPLERAYETLFLYGLTKPLEVFGAEQYQVAPESLMIRVHANWENLEVLL